MAKTLVPVIEGTSVELGFDSEAREAIARFAEAKRVKAEAEKELAEAEAVIRQKLGNAEFATVGGVTVLKIVVVQNRIDLDRTKLKAEHGEAWAACSYNNPYDYLKVVS